MDQQLLAHFLRGERRAQRRASRGRIELTKMQSISQVDDGPGARYSVAERVQGPPIAPLNKRFGLWKPFLGPSRRVEDP